jgi:site-specific DNA recombinase
VCTQWAIAVRKYARTVRRASTTRPEENTVQCRIPDGNTVETTITDDGETQQVIRRPGRKKRKKVYEPFTAYKVEIAPGTKPVYLYLRLSNFHNDAADAIERQRIDLERKLAAEGCWTIVGEYVDNDSASKYAARARRGYTQMCEDIHAGRVPNLAFWKLDRVERIPARLLDLFDVFREKTITLRSVYDSDEELNGRSRLLAGLKALLGEEESDTGSLRQKAKKKSTAEAGFWHGGQRPFGWIEGPKEVDALGRSGTRLIPHPVEHPALKRGVGLALAGSSTSRIAEAWASEFGLVAADGANIHQGSVLRFLRSPRLCGYRMREVPAFKRGNGRLNLMEHVQRDDQDKPIVVMEPVCDEDTWWRLQAAIDSRDANGGRKRAYGLDPRLLTGFLRCGHCGNAMYGSERSKGPGKQRVVQYQCRTRVNRGRAFCVGRSISAHAEAYVAEWVLTYCSDEQVSKARQALEDELSQEGGAGDLFRSMEEARAEKTALEEMHVAGQFRGALGMRDYVRLSTEVNDRIMRLEQQTSSALRARRELPRWSGDELRARWEHMTMEEQRRLLALVIERIEIGPIIERPGPVRFDPERITITPRF